MLQQFGSLVVCALLAVALLPPAALAQPAKQATNIKLPTAPEQWLNFPPLSLTRLEGKGLVFIYFDERSEKFAEKWPKLLESSRRHQLDPVVFVAVNSGNSPAVVAQYVQQFGITWPVIVDTDRSFERATLGLTVDMPADVQVRILTTDRKWMPRSDRLVDRAAIAAAKNGKWLVNPNSVPLKLRPAWGLIELGHYSAALPLITRSTRRGNDDLKATAETLQSTVALQMDKELTTIREHIDSDRPWQAYKALGLLLEGFDGYDIPPEMQEKHRELAKSDAIRNQQAAAKKLQLALRAGAKNTPSAIKRATKMLQRVVDEYPETEAAKEAQGLLDGVGGGVRSEASNN